MLPTYKATLNGTQLKWAEQAPVLQENVSVYVTILQEPLVSAAQGAEMAEALTQLAKMGGLTAISDPTAWQREQRQERDLVGRDD